MNTPGNEFHKLNGDLENFYAVKINANRRLVFKFDGEDMVEVDYTDYH